jgi:two-component system response regulator DesR
LAEQLIAPQPQQGTASALRRNGSATTDPAPSEIAASGRPGYLRRALDQGASGFVLKDAPASELAGAVRQVVGGGHVIDPSLAAAAIAAGESPLTAREQDVLRAARSHETTADIAAALYLSEGTVRNYLSAAIQKLGVRNRSEAIDLAVDQGWL